MLYKVVVTLASLVFGFFIIGAAVYWQLAYGERSGRDPRSDPGAAPAQSSFTLEELAEHDGKDGNDCYVAVDGDVYLIEGFARRPQLQERLTAQIADALFRDLGSRGSFVVIEAEQLCMTMRGAQKPGTVTVTSAMRGVFDEEPGRRAEAMALISRGEPRG